MDNTDYCSYELAVKLKESGFDWPYYHFYQSQEYGMCGHKLRRNCSKVDLNKVDKNLDYFVEHGYIYSAPTLWEAQKWLREEKKWHIIIEPRIWEQQVYDFKLWHIRRGYENANRGFDYLSYESALSAGISAALELIGKEEE